MNEIARLRARLEALEETVRTAGFVATVDSVSGGLIKIKRPGQSTADAVFSPAAAGLAAAVSAGDKVWCVERGQVIVLVEVVTS